MKNFSLENVYDQIERMKRADMPKADCNITAYGNALCLSLDDMPKLSGKAYGLLMEMLFAAYQLGQNRNAILYQQEQERKQSNVSQNRRL